MRRIALICLASLTLLIEQSTAAEPPETSLWTDATGNLGGSEWVKDGVWKVVGVPKSNTLICSMTGLGLWSSDDGGATWKRMGAEGSRPPNLGQAVQFVFDPQDSKRFWASGMYKFAVWRTDDGSATFQQLGTQSHVDGIGVDFTDPERKTLLIGLHEQPRSLQKSTDGGKTWVKIGDKLPEKSNFSTDPIVLDAKTYLTSGAGWKQGLPWGIYRTEDGGDNWAKVSEFGASGNPFIASDGAIYWAVLWDNALIKSADAGKTWTRLQGPVRGLPVELPGHRLVAVKGTQLYASSDGGTTWSAFGETIPFVPSGLAYSEGRKSIVAYRQNLKGPRVIVRWDLPADLESAFKVVLPGNLVAWDGEGINGGNGWANGGSVKAQSKEKHSGNNALEYRLASAEKFEGGWNWYSWAQVNLTDASEFKFLSFWIKFSGGAKPELRVALNCGPNKISSEYVPVLKYNPAALDGQWCEVRVPLPDLRGAKGDFDVKNVYELRLAASGAKDCSVFVDDIRFDNLEAPTRP